MSEDIKKRGHFETGHKEKKAKYPGFVKRDPTDHSVSIIMREEGAPHKQRKGKWRMLPNI